MAPHPHPVTSSAPTPVGKSHLDRNAHGLTPSVVPDASSGRPEDDYLQRQTIPSSHVGLTEATAPAVRPSIGAGINAEAQTPRAPSPSACDEHARETGTVAVHGSPASPPDAGVARPVETNAHPETASGSEEWDPHSAPKLSSIPQEDAMPSTERLALPLKPAVEDVTTAKCNNSHANPAVTDLRAPTDCDAAHVMQASSLPLGPSVRETGSIAEQVEAVARTQGEENNREVDEPAAKEHPAGSELSPPHAGTHALLEEAGHSLPTCRHVEHSAHVEHVEERTGHANGRAEHVDVNSKTDSENGEHDSSAIDPTRGLSEERVKLVAAFSTHLGDIKPSSCHEAAAHVSQPHQSHRTEGEPVVPPAGLPAHAKNHGENSDADKCDQGVHVPEARRQDQIQFQEHHGPDHVVELAEQAAYVAEQARLAEEDAKFEEHRAQHRAHAVHQNLSGLGAHNGDHAGYSSHPGHDGDAPHPSIPENNTSASEREKHDGATHGKHIAHAAHEGHTGCPEHGAHVRGLVDPGHSVPSHCTARAAQGSQEPQSGLEKQTEHVHAEHSVQIHYDTNVLQGPSDVEVSHVQTEPATESDPLAGSEHPSVGASRLDDSPRLVNMPADGATVDHLQHHGTTEQDIKLQAIHAAATSSQGCRHTDLNRHCARAQTRHVGPGEEPGTSKTRNAHTSHLDDLQHSVDAQVATRAGKRYHATPEQLSALLYAFENNHSPSADTLKQLSTSTGMPLPNLVLWFKNRRARSQKRPTSIPETSPTGRRSYVKSGIYSKKAKGCQASIGDGQRPHAPDSRPRVVENSILGASCSIVAPSVTTALHADHQHQEQHLHQHHIRHQVLRNHHNHSHDLHSSGDIHQYVTVVTPDAQPETTLCANALPSGVPAALETKADYPVPADVPRGVKRAESSPVAPAEGEVFKRPRNDFVEVLGDANPCSVWDSDMCMTRFSEFITATTKNREHEQIEAARKAANNFFFEEMQNGLTVTSAVQSLQALLDALEHVMDSVTCKSGSKLNSGSRALVREFVAQMRSGKAAVIPRVAEALQ